MNRPRPHPGDHVDPPLNRHQQRGRAGPWLTGLTLLGLACALAGEAPANQARGAIKAPPLPTLSADQAAERAWARTGGRVISIRTEQDGYWVRMLGARGQVEEVWVPSNNH